MHKLKIVFLLDEFDYGGVSTIILNIFELIDKSKFQLSLLLFNKNPKSETRIPNYVFVRHLFSKAPNKINNRLLRYFFEFIKYLIPKPIIRFVLYKDSFDFAVDFKGNNLQSLLAFKGEKIVWLHKDFSLESNIYDREIKNKYGKTLSYKFKEFTFINSLMKVNDLIFISETTRDGFTNRYGLKFNTNVLYNPINSIKIIELSDELINDWKKRKFTICCVSRISKGKGIERLYSITKQLNNEGFDFDLIIIGSGDYFKDIKLLHNSYNLPNILLFGHRDNPYKYIKNCELFVCPSETEAFSTVVNEAKILRTFIISTNTGAINEILKDYKNSIIVENSINGLLNSIRSILKSNTIPNITNYSILGSNYEIQKIEQYFLDKYKNVK